MLARIKRAWHRFAAREPGKRFKDMHREHQAARKSVAARVGYMALAIVIIAVGIVTLPAPGPGSLVLALGLGMIARESMTLARFLDYAELKARHAWRRLRRRYKHRTT